jgi:AcrR family transcriptional regulator
MASLPEHLSAPKGELGKLPQEVREDHQRDRVIAAAIDVFAKRGFRGTTIDHLVAASKVSFGTFYGLFEGKEDCFLHVYDRILTESHKQIADLVPADVSWSEQTAIVLRGLVELISTEPMRARVALIESQTGGPRALARYQEMIDSVIPLLRRGRQESTIADRLSPTLEEAVIGGVVWLLHQQLLKEGPESIEATFPELIDIVIGPYVGAEEAARLARAGSHAGR